MMTLAKVEHILRAAGNATGQKAFVLVGSSAIFVWSRIVPETHDLALSKLCAGREKDMDWLVAAMEASIIDTGQMRVRLPAMPVERVLGGLEILNQRLTIIESRALA